MNLPEVSGITTRPYRPELVPLKEFRSMMNTNQRPESLCAELVQAANDGGGRDNITMIIASFEDPPEAGNIGNDSEAYDVLFDRSDTVIGCVSPI